MHVGRRVGFMAFLGVVAAVMFTSYAWGVQVGSHTGFTWICKNTASVTCNMSGVLSDGSNLRPTRALSFYSQASGLSALASYDMRWVVGDHTADTDSACSTGTIFTGGANIIASSNGSWSGKGPLTMPNMTGDITVCTQPLAGNSSTNFLGSKNTLWTLVL